MRVAFYVGNKAASDIDYSNPEAGNDGGGAAHYLHVAIPYYLKKNEPSVEQAIILAQDARRMPKDIEVIEVSSVVDAARVTKERGFDLFVFRPRQNEEDGILTVIDELELPSVGRAALTPNPLHLRKMAATKYFKALVCVGREQYDCLIDTIIAPKIFQIDNGIFANSFLSGKNVKKDDRLVVYLGALTAQKGFHYLAEAWPDVLKAVPDAKLKVIGSARVYDSAAELGPWGVADRSYEEKYLLPVLSAPDGRPHPSVHFMGRMGVEKNELLQQATVGVANPTGQTETSCVSAIEIQACGTPVVSGAYFALLDTVVHSKTGLLGKSRRALAENISALLLDPKRARAMGDAASRYARDRYDLSVVGPRWVELFQIIRNGHSFIYEPPRRNLLSHAKLIRMANRPLQKTVGTLVAWPSVHECTELLRWIKTRYKSRHSITALSR